MVQLDGDLLTNPGEEPRRPPAAEPPRGAPPIRERRRSFCFLDHGGERWTAYLATYVDGGGACRGYFAFRHAGTEPEVRTAILFVERDESEVDARARGLGRPLIRALLDSALHAAQRRSGASPDVHRWFRELLRRRTPEPFPLPPADRSAIALEQLRSLYESYRLDQVAHLVWLIEPEPFRELVERLLEGREIDFVGSDRLQLAMLVVQEIERHLVLPPFEDWAEDFLANPGEYQAYTHALHRGEELP